MNYFTHYWQNETWESNRKSNPEGTLLKHISGNSFTKRGVKVGDAIYVVTVKKGKLYLCGKLIVGKFCNVYEAAKDLGLPPEELWQAAEHIAASEATTHLWDLEVPLTITEQLELLSGNEIVYPKFVSPGKLDRQTFRIVRQLEPKSAAMLDKLLGDLEPIESQSNEEQKTSLWNQETTYESAENAEFESGVEGNKKQRYTTYYERIPENRKQAIKIHGVTCKACDFNFEKKYGSHGKDFIHVHHIKPVSQFEKPKKINPETDLIPLCPNCHSMVHRFKSKTLSLEELKKIIQ